MLINKPIRCISQSFEMQPPPEASYVYVGVRRPISEDVLLVFTVEWHGEPYSEYDFQAVRHFASSDGKPSSYWDLKWADGYETLDMAGATFEDWAEQVFRCTKAIRNTK